MVDQEAAFSNFFYSCQNQQVICRSKHKYCFKLTLLFHPFAAVKDVQADNKISLDKKTMSSAPDQNKLFRAINIGLEKPDPVAVPGMMNPAGGIARGAVSGTNNEKEEEWYENKKEGGEFGVNEEKYGGEYVCQCD